MSFDDLFRKDRPNKMLQIAPSLVGTVGGRNATGAPFLAFFARSGP
jgi:hypothetical protein